MVRKRSVQKASMKLIFLVVILATAIASVGLRDNSAYAAEPASPVTGTWSGTISGEGPLDTFYELKFDANISGTFEGDTSGGEWVGKFYSNYTVFPVHAKGEDTGNVTGSYTVTIDDSGLIAGEGRVEVSGVLTGELEFTIEGVKSESGYVSGTWNGFLTSQSLSYGGTPVKIDVKLGASGEFEGKVKSVESPSPTPTTPSPTTPTPIPPTSPTRPPTTSPQIQPPDQYLLYTIIMIVTVAIIAGGYALMRKRKTNIK